MSLIEKSILNWNEQDLIELRSDPKNIEGYLIEYKVTYDSDAEELRKDVVSFANSQRGFILYGIQDEPFEIIGISRKEVDILKNVIETVINIKIDPRLEPSPILNSIPLSNGKYILGVEIFPKQRGIFGIRQNNNPNNSNFETYEFWLRLNGKKKRMSMEDVNFQISKNDPYKKFIEVNLELRGYVPAIFGEKQVISVEGINKSIRPITVKGYGLSLKDKSESLWAIHLVPPNLNPSTIGNTRLPVKLEDGDHCVAMYTMESVSSDIVKNNLQKPIKIQGFINSNDGVFYSKEFDLESAIWKDK